MKFWLLKNELSTKKSLWMSNLEWIYAGYLVLVTWSWFLGSSSLLTIQKFKIMPIFELVIRNFILKLFHQTCCFQRK